MAHDQQAIADEIIDNFEFLGDWEERYSYLFDLARKLPPMDAADKTEENKVHGCQSNVWIVAQPRSTPEGEVIEFVADSDALITKGIIALLHRVYSGQPVEKILSFDIESFLDKIGLSQHLSLNRRNGLFGMIQRIKTLAATLTHKTATAT